MQRRGMYMYGGLLPHDEKGLVDNGLGKRTPFGSASLIAPTIDITETGQNITIDGVDMQFHYCTNTEAPVEIDIWFPDHKALFMAEIAWQRTLLLTLRGAQIRILSPGQNAWMRHELYGDQLRWCFRPKLAQVRNDKVIVLLENSGYVQVHHCSVPEPHHKGAIHGCDRKYDRSSPLLQMYWYTHG